MLRSQERLRHCVPIEVSWRPVASSGARGTIAATVGERFLSSHPPICRPAPNRRKPCCGFGNMMTERARGTTTAVEARSRSVGNEPLGSGEYEAHERPAFRAIHEAGLASVCLRDRLDDGETEPQPPESTLRDRRHPERTARR
jgi:hypothetical protein